MFFLLQQIPSWFNIISCWFSHPVTQLALSCRHSAGTLLLLVSLSHVQGGWGESMAGWERVECDSLGSSPRCKLCREGVGWTGRKPCDWNTQCHAGRGIFSEAGEAWSSPLCSLGSPWKQFRNMDLKVTGKSADETPSVPLYPSFLEVTHFSMAKRLLTPMD